MSWIKKPVDQQNKSLQFDITEDATSLHYQLAEPGQTADNAAERFKVLVERVRQNAPNEVLFNGTQAELNNVLGLFNTGVSRKIIPFSVNKVLKITPEDKIVLTIDFSELTILPTVFKYQLSKYGQKSEVPFMIKKVDFEDQVTLNSSDFNFVALTTQHDFETVVMSNETGVYSPKKVFIPGPSIYQMVKDSASWIAPISLKPNQDFTVSNVDFPSPAATVMLIRF